MWGLWGVHQVPLVKVRWVSFPDKIKSLVSRLISISRSTLSYYNIAYESRPKHRARGIKGS